MSGIYFTFRRDLHEGLSSAVGGPGVVKLANRRQRLLGHTVTHALRIWLCLITYSHMVQRETPFSGGGASGLSEGKAWLFPASGHIFPFRNMESGAGECATRRPDKAPPLVLNLIPRAVMAPGRT